MSFSLDDIMNVREIVLLIGYQLGNIRDIATCGGLSRMYCDIFLLRKYYGKSLANMVIRHNFVTRLANFLPVRPSQLNVAHDYVALSFCRFLSRYDYCFSGGGVLASMTGIAVGDTEWERGRALIKIDVYIKATPVNFVKRLYGWVKSMGDYLETNLETFTFSAPGESIFRGWVPSSIPSSMSRKRGEWYTSHFNEDCDHQFINFYFMKRNVNPKQFIVNYSDITFLANWISINANGDCTLKIGHIKHVLKKAGKFSAFYKAEFEEDWDEWRLDHRAELWPDDIELQSRRSLYENRGYRFYGRLPRQSFHPAISPFEIVLEDGDSGDDDDFDGVDDVDDVDDASI